MHDSIKNQLTKFCLEQQIAKICLKSSLHSHTNQILMKKSLRDDFQSRFGCSCCNNYLKNTILCTLACTHSPLPYDSTYPSYLLSYQTRPHISRSYTLATRLTLLPRPYTLSSPKGQSYHYFARTTLSLVLLFRSCCFLARAALLRVLLSCSRCSPASAAFFFVLFARPCSSLACAVCSLVLFFLSCWFVARVDW